MAMSIFLFTDFGAADLYVGQVKAVLQQHASNVPVIDLLHDAPSFNVQASAHLLAALSMQIPPGSVTLAVVDPGVGGARDAVALDADGSWYIGPDNGLLSVLAVRAKSCTYWRITWRPEKLSASFHGRDLFAPVTGAIARSEFPAGKAESVARLSVGFGGHDLGEIIYIDHYGNAFSGLRAQNVPRDARIVTDGRYLKHARVFSDVPAGGVCWYENSLGLVEIAGNACSAAENLGLQIGQSVAVETG
jgi:S-adenosylmethionine hydrolase